MDAESVHRHHMLLVHVERRPVDPRLGRLRASGQLVSQPTVSLSSASHDMVHCGSDQHHDRLRRLLITNTPYPVAAAAPQAKDPPVWGLLSGILVR